MSSDTVVTSHSSRFYIVSGYVFLQFCPPFFNQFTNTLYNEKTIHFNFKKIKRLKPLTREANEKTTEMASLPYADVDNDLRALAGRAEGFGRFAIGGLHGAVYTVTNLAGSLSFTLLSPPITI